MDNLLEVSHIFKYDDNDRVTLQDLSFSQRRLQKVAIAGETGSGKSTLLKIVSGLERCDSGQVIFEGQRVLGPDEKLVPGHPGIAYLSQHFELPKFLRVEQILSYANVLSAEYAEGLYETCHIDHLMTRKSSELSGGEKQRVALAKLLLSSPKLLLLDEPFSNLDIQHKHVLKSVIYNLSDSLNISCVLISHDPADVLSWAEKILVMRSGTIVQSGTPEEIYRRPVDKYVAELFGKCNYVDPKVVDIKSPNNEILVRPEDITLVNEGDVVGHILQKKFYGSHYELKIQIGETALLATSKNDNNLPGDVVHVSINHDRIWPI